MRTKHKFNAVRTELDGYSFASKAEAKRYAELKLMLKAGLIEDIEVQFAFRLMVQPDSSDAEDAIILGEYRADFAYTDTRTRQPVYEDVKGVKTALYLWKKKHVEAQYGITITEIT